MESKTLKDEVKRLVDIMKTLRGPQGCPWDKKQDYYSLQPYIIEEAYEVVEALQLKDLELLKEELGDLLLQVVFQAQIGKENGDFNLSEIIAGLNAKLIRRHPHVFEGRSVETASEVRQLWDDIKKNENQEKQKKSLLDESSQRQPALNQAYDIQKKAADVGFDWNNIEDVLDKIEEEIDEVREAIARDDQQGINDEIGDLIFAVVNLARFKNINPELSLLSSILKFKKRFQYIENRLKEKGKNIEETKLKELDFYWEESKKRRNN